MPNEPNQSMKKSKNSPSKGMIAKSEPAKVPPAEPVPAKLAANSPPPRGSHVCFELIQPNAKTVFVAGSFNDWRPETTPLTPAGNGRWVGDLAVKPGRYEYLFVVDGQWLPDPNAKESVENPFGGKNSIIGVSA
jgi:1,4-alpha-glucan branching enzyme